MVALCVTFERIKNYGNTCCVYIESKAIRHITLKSRKIREKRVSKNEES